MPHRLFSVRVDPARASLRHPFQDKKWRKFQLSSLFGSYNVPSKVHTLDVLLTEDGNQTVDKWLIVQSLGSGHTRDMALDRSLNPLVLKPEGCRSAIGDFVTKFVLLMQEVSVLQPYTYCWCCSTHISRWGGPRVVI